MSKNSNQPFKKDKIYCLLNWNNDRDIYQVQIVDIQRNSMQVLNSCQKYFGRNI